MVAVMAKERKSAGQSTKPGMKKAPIGKRGKQVSKQPPFHKSPERNQPDSATHINLDTGVWLQKVKVPDLKPNSWNPNEMEAQMFDRLKDRISKVGFRDPILCRPDLIITDGEHRWKALMDLGKEDTWVIVADESEEDAKIETSTSNLIKGEFNPIKYGQYLTDLLKRHSVEELADLIPTPKMQIEALTQLVADLPQYTLNELRDMSTPQKWVIKLEFGSEVEYKEAFSLLEKITKAQRLTSNAAAGLFVLRSYSNAL